VPFANTGEIYTAMTKTTPRNVDTMGAIVARRKSLVGRLIAMTVNASKRQIVDMANGVNMVNVVKLVEQANEQGIDQNL